jgi:DNA-binding response OmpR family regulator
MGNKKILIVDDDPDVRLGVHLRLKANHYDTFFADDAFGAIDEARKHEPDLIILDLGLVAGDGFQVMERLKEVLSLAVIPVIVVSARDRLALCQIRILEVPPSLPQLCGIYAQHRSLDHA